MSIFTQAVTIKLQKKWPCSFSDQLPYCKRMHDPNMMDWTSHPSPSLHPNSNYFKDKFGCSVGLVGKLLLCLLRWGATFCKSASDSQTNILKYIRKCSRYSLKSSIISSLSLFCREGGEAKPSEWDFFINLWLCVSVAKLCCGCYEELWSENFTSFRSHPHGI